MEPADLAAQLVAAKLTGTHCWHPTGGGKTRGYEIYETDCCCNCGIHSQRVYKGRGELYPGHGPYVQTDARDLLRRETGPDGDRCRNA